MKKILLVEYDENFGSILENVLKSNGFSVVQVRNGAEAQKCFESSQFDLVLLEIRLPIVDGMDLLYWIREQSQVPVILIPAHIPEDELEKATTLGVSTVLQKPFKTNDVLGAIRALIN